MNKDVDIIHDKRDARIEELERRVKYCEQVASQYKYMFEQLESKLKAFNDRQDNIQMVYDYLTRVGSDLTIKNPHLKRTLNPMTKTLPKDSPKYLEMLKTFEFKAGDEVYYADENNNRITYHLINGIDIIDKHPRYCISNIFGYIDESKLFKTESDAQWQLDEWKRMSNI